MLIVQCGTITRQWISERVPPGPPADEPTFERVVHTCGLELSGVESFHSSDLLAKLGQNHQHYTRLLGQNQENNYFKLPFLSEHMQGCYQLPVTGCASKAAAGKSRAEGRT